MPQNIELKQKVEDFSSIVKILEKKGVNRKEILNQRDIYFEHPEGLLKLRIVNERGELIFYRRDESNSDRISNYRILNVEPQQAESFCKSIFKIEVEVVKKRTLMLFRNTRIHLDEVEKLGKYIELETVVQNSTEEGIVEFNEVVELLKLNLDEQLKTSYRTLLLNK